MTFSQPSSSSLHKFSIGGGTRDEALRTWEAAWDPEAMYLSEIFLAPGKSPDRFIGIFFVVVAFAQKSYTLI